VPALHSKDSTTSATRPPAKPFLCSSYAQSHRAARLIVCLVALSVSACSGPASRAPADDTQSVKRAVAARSHYDRGLDYYERGEYAKAVEELDAALAAKPKDAYVCLARGIVYNAMGEVKRAIADFNAAIELKPDFADAYLNRGATYVKMGRYTAAINDLDQAIHLNPRSAEAFYNRGGAFAEQRQHERAIDDYTNAIRLRPRFAEAYVNRGANYFRDGKNEQAIADYDQALRINSNLAEAYEGRAAALRRKGLFKRAVENYNAALQLKPQHQRARSNRGKIYFFLRNYASAAEDFAHASGEGHDALWLYLTRAKLGENAAQELRQRAVETDLSRWPGPLISYRLGKITQERLLALNANPDAEIERARKCETSVYLAEFALIDAKRASAEELFRQALSLCPVHSVESQLAEIELKRSFN
jgi:lipoprotein NlpI